MAEDFVDKKYLCDFIERNNFEKMYVEYKGFLSNHVTQAAIALHRLGDIKGTKNWF